MYVLQALASCLFLLQGAVDPLQVIGNRTDKDSVACAWDGTLVAFAGNQVYWSTFALGPVFSALDCPVVRWDPHVLTLGRTKEGVEETRRIVALGYVPLKLVAEYVFENKSDKEARVPLVLSGHVRNAHDFRQKPAARHTPATIAGGHRVLLEVPGVPGGLTLAIGLVGSRASTGGPSDYRLERELTLAPGERKAVRAALVASTGLLDQQNALGSLDAALAIPLEDKGSASRPFSEADPVARSRAHWHGYFFNDVPRFESSDRRLTELYYLRWWLLAFATVDNTGAFKHPVVLEGRSAYQTYCCYSAPFLAMDLKWHRIPRRGEGHHLAMATLAHADGRYPWYSTLTTTAVPVHHASATGHSFLAATAWRQYLVDGNQEFLGEVYPWMAENSAWWASQRDGDGDGLFRIDDMLETGMDDAPRGIPKKGDAWQPMLGADLASYRAMDLDALAKMARVLGKTEDAERFRKEHERVLAAIRSKLWQPDRAWFADLRASDFAVCPTKTTAGFYPFFADVATKEHMPAFQHLLSEKEFWLPFPVPSVAADEPAFDPKSYWSGPAWPATSCHVVDGFARAAKRFDPSLLPKARELLDRCVRVFFTPRPDFYERYDPKTGQPLSKFRDYMHSWWIDLIVQHLAGVMPVDEGLWLHSFARQDEWFTLDNLRIRGHDVDVQWKDGRYVVRVDRKVVLDRAGLPAGELLKL